MQKPFKLTAEILLFIASLSVSVPTILKDLHISYIKQLDYSLSISIAC